MTYTIYSYDTDPRYRVTSVAHWRQGNPTPLAEISCPSRDGAGNPLSMTDWTGSTTYTYDANRRLDSAVYPGTGLVDYNYDWVGNRDNPPPDPNGLVFDAADRLLGWPGRYSYNYYPDGSQREVRDGMGVLLRTYSYTPAGLLGRVDYPGQISPAFHY